MYYVLILGSISLIIVLSYFGFRALESLWENRFSSAQMAFFYGYAALVYGFAAVLVSWITLYNINLFIGMPALIVLFACRKRAQRLNAPKYINQIALGLGLIAMGVGLVNALRF